MTELIELLDEIAKNKEFHIAIMDEDEDAIRKISDDYFKKFEIFYSRVERHKYSDVSKYISDEIPDKMDHLREGILCIIESAQKNEYDMDDAESSAKKCYVKIVKLHDHIELELLHLSNINKLKFIGESFDRQKNEIDASLRKVEKNIKKSQNRIKSLSEQVISILGIFAGIIVTFSFATSSIGEALAHLTELNAIYLGFIICLLGLVFVNAISLLMIFVWKLSGNENISAAIWVAYGITNLVLVFMIIFFCCKISSLNTAGMIEVLNNIASKCDVILPGIKEGNILTGKETKEEIADFYLNNGAKAVVIKNGPSGAYLKTLKEEKIVPGFKVKKVVDTVGAGDGFATGVLSGLLDGQSYENALIKGNAIGALMVTSKGDNSSLPTQEELEEFIMSHERAVI